ncbi:MAG: hypothetical protein PHO41_02460 [Eubacteriales bacterium]|nr:hypothetical protein [Eubacteriales bacterium]
MADRTVRGKIYAWLSSDWTHFGVYKLFDLVLIYCAMMISEARLNNPVLGGAVCLALQVWVVYYRLFRKKNAKYLPKDVLASGLMLFIAAALLTAALLFVYPAIANTADFLLTLGAIVGMMLVRLLVEALDIKVHRPFKANDTAVVDVEQLNTISAYRAYSRMTANVFIALNITLITYICYLRFSEDLSPTAVGLRLAVWLGLLALAAVGIVRFLRRKSAAKYDKPSVFAAGAVMFCVGCIGQYRNWFGLLGNVVNQMFWGFGLACMMAIIIAMGQDMQDVIEFGASPAEREHTKQNTMLLMEWGVMLSTLLLLLLMTMTAFLTEGKLDALETRLGLQNMMLMLTLLIPPIFIIVAIGCALMQPLNRDYEKKLAHYREQQRQGNVNRHLETRLQFQLLKGSRKIAPRVFRGLVRPFMPCKVLGAEHVDTEHGPVIFTCNHLEIYGPLITNIHLPFYFRSWIIASMLDEHLVSQQMQSGMEILFHWLPKGFVSKVTGPVSRLVCWVLRGLDPIPVYRSGMREVIKTIKLTVDAMEYEDNILLFPENAHAEGEPGQYKEEGVSVFFSGFAAIAQEYYKRTGSCTTFYPIYANKKKRTLTIGEGTRFDPNNGKNEEKQRITQYLHDWMEAQSLL